ncbi:hypothetical protein LZ32DRAFT_152836 [Colletotrichum eremochloae]|nr:hypothetical protein LZ32DRAFT_152836 [Colletotrichum eremochloae]
MTGFRRRWTLLSQLHRYLDALFNPVTYPGQLSNPPSLPPTVGGFLGPLMSLWLRRYGREAHLSSVILALRHTSAACGGVCVCLPILPHLTYLPRDTSVPLRRADTGRQFRLQKRCVTSCLHFSCFPVTGA